MRLDGVPRVAANAVGDGGASVGLLQLHDEYQGAGMTVEQREDPEANLSVSMRAIAEAWRKTAGLSGRDRVERVAALSGHPANPEFLAEGVAKDGALKNIDRIGRLWESLEAAHPPAAAGGRTPAPLNLDAAAGALDAAMEWARAHPELVAAGVAAAVLVAL